MAFGIVASGESPIETPRLVASCADLCMICNSNRRPIQVMGHWQCPDCWTVTETCCEGAPA